MNAALTVVTTVMVRTGSGEGNTNDGVVRTVCMVTRAAQHEPTN